MEPRTAHRLAIVAVAAILAVPVSGTGMVAAATLDVTTTVDGGPGSLRDALALASASGEADEIVLQPGATYVLDDCVEGELSHTATDELTIIGNGARIEQTCADERVLRSLGPLTVEEVTITGGVATGGLGGGISADTTSVTLVRSTVTGNAASSGGGVAAIRVTLLASTVAGNDAASTGGGVWADQTLETTNTTISGNTAGAGGGGAVVVNDTLAVRYTTIAANSSPTGANVQLQPGAAALDSFASVLAAPAGGASCDLAAGVVVTSHGGNVASDDSCDVGAGAGDLADAGEVGLGPLGDHGGPTATMVPAGDSVLIDRTDCAGAPVAVDRDQRGVTRPQGAACDSGAVEVVVAPGEGLPAEPADPRDDARGAPGAASRPVAAPTPIRFTG